SGGDRALDLRARADDPGIAGAAAHVALAEARHLRGIEPRERLPKRVALAEHGDPGEARLKAVEHELLPESARVALGDAPLFVVVRPHQRIALCPSASLALACRHPLVLPEIGSPLQIEAPSKVSTGS